MCFENKIWKAKLNQILSICFNLLHLKYSKTKLENEIYFLILLKYNSRQIQQLQHWYSKCTSKEFCLSAWNGRANVKVNFNQNAIAVSLFLLELSFAYNPAFYFNMGKNYEEIYHFPPHVSVITGKILITITWFVCYHLLFVSNSTFMTDSIYLGTII